MNTDRHHHESSLEARLRADARATRVTPPEGLEQRISAAVWREKENARSETEPKRRPFRFFSPAMAGLVTSACALALVVFWHRRPDDPGVNDADIRYLVDTVQALPARLASAELPSATTITVSGPLTREIESVRADARSALDFLAANFVPSQMLGRTSETAGAAQSSET
jgi:hypothetical protein